MKKAFRIIRTIIIVVLVFVVVALLLKWRPLDNFLTSKFGEALVSEEKPHTLIKIGGYHRLLDPSEKPYVYSESGRLYTYYGGRSVDITPPGVSTVFFGEQSGIREKLRYRDHACLDKESASLLFVVDVQDVPVLFLADLAAGGCVKIAENVDSFTFIGGRPVYAQGYSKYNQLMVYDGGESRTVAENVTCVPVYERDAVLLNDVDGGLKYYSVAEDKLLAVSDGSDEITGYSAFADNYMLIYCKSGGNYQSVLFDSLSGKASRNIIDSAPDRCYSGGDSAFIFDVSEGAVSAVDTQGESRQVFADAGHVYKVFSGSCSGENGGTFKAVFATKKGIFSGTLDASGETVTQLCAFKGALKQYASHPWLITYHMEAEAAGEGDFEKGFYLSALSGQSNIVNKSNPKSWLNKLSSYVYRLFYVSEGKAAECDVPPSRAVALPETLSGETVTYTAYYAGGTVKSISALSGAEVLSRDVLKSAGLAKGSSEIRAERAGGDLYITVRNNPGASDEYLFCCVLRSDGRTLSNASEEPVVSFGEYYEQLEIDG
jgi:hypothetical protein